MPALTLANEYIAEQVGALTAAAATMAKPTALLGAPPSAFPFLLTSNDGAEVTIEGVKQKAAGEVVEVTGEAAGEYTIVRGREGTSAKEHAAGVIWANLVNAAYIEGLLALAGRPGGQVLQGIQGWQSANLAVVAGNNNNVALPEQSYIRVTPAIGSNVITGIAGGKLGTHQGRAVMLQCATSGRTFELSPQNVASEVKNRFQFEAEEAQVIRFPEIVTLQYDADLEKWRNVSKPILPIASRPSGSELGVAGSKGNPASRAFGVEGNGATREYTWNMELTKQQSQGSIFPAIAITRLLAGGEWTRISEATAGVTFTFTGTGNNEYITVKIVFAVAPEVGVLVNFTALG